MTCDPSRYIMDHPDFIVCSFMENSIGLKRVKINLITKHSSLCLEGDQPSLTWTTSCAERIKLYIRLEFNQKFNRNTCCGYSRTI